MSLFGFHSSPTFEEQIDHSIRERKSRRAPIPNQDDQNTRRILDTYGFGVWPCDDDKVSREEMI